ncbi:MAG: hypothetical protein K6F77_04085, partial [Lachnospiraceae bacterium]|nr:hypothetical protein [Lachnospiraceae bacterium]
SSIGSFALSWFPCLFAIFMGFSKKAHILGLILFAALIFVVDYLIKNQVFKKLFGKSESNASKRKRGAKRRELNRDSSSKEEEVKRPSYDFKGFLKNDFTVIILIALYVFTVITLDRHTIPMKDDGAMYAGQCTYGDMNMHLGFITSIAKQQFFPPEYSLLPGTRLAYPFLSDSISSSVYLFGTSLRVAYLLPMYFALLQVFFGMYAIVKFLLKKSGKFVGIKSCLASVFFLFNGGFGFWYFTNKGFGDDNFKRIFTEFYQTPTNYMDENIQWHNVICDMLIPQRATLFGWAILFPTLYIVLRAFYDKEKKYFIPAGILAGGLVLIHTHSFLALGMLCVVFVTLEVFESFNKGGGTKEISKLQKFLPAVLTIIVLAFMSILSHRKVSGNPVPDKAILAMGLVVVLIGIGFLVFGIVKGVKDKTITIKELFYTWGIFLIIVCVLALPQLLGFTFKQAQGEQFVRGVFNWRNDEDEFLKFYVINIGVVFITSILALMFGNKRQRKIMLPPLYLWMICEFIVFQPNTYDNNKLLLVAYLFFCIASADFIIETIPCALTKISEKLKPAVIPVMVVLFAVTLFFGSFSGVLTMGREYVSEYQLYGADYVKLAEWVEDNSNPSDVFLTANNHNNAVASLTGRNIVCGSGTFLYFHGLDYGGAEAAAKAIYEDPSQRDSLISQYNVKYIVVGPVETNTYAIPDLDTMKSTYPVVYDEEGICVMQVKN